MAIDMLSRTDNWPWKAFKMSNSRLLLYADVIRKTSKNEKKSLSTLLGIQRGRNYGGIIEKWGKSYCHNVYTKDDL